MRRTDWKNGTLCMRMLAYQFFSPVWYLGFLNLSINLYLPAEKEGL